MNEKEREDKRRQEKTRGGTVLDAPPAPHGGARARHRRSPDRSALLSSRAHECTPPPRHYLAPAWIGSMQRCGIAAWPPRPTISTANSRRPHESVRIRHSALLVTTRHYSSLLVNRHSTHVTRHTSLVTHHTSLATRHSSLVTRHSSLAVVVVVVQTLVHPCAPHRHLLHGRAGAPRSLGRENTPGARRTDVPRRPTP